MGDAPKRSTGAHHGWQLFRGLPGFAQTGFAVIATIMVVGLLAVAAGPPASKQKIAATGPTSTTERPAPAPTAPLGQPDRFHPDATLTPGAIFADVTAAQVCMPGYSASVRQVSDGTRERVLAAYGIVDPAPRAYQIDHLIPLELGGSNDMKNLWPEPVDGSAGSHRKDVIENQLHDAVCAGSLSLTDAQHSIFQWDTVDVIALTTTTTVSTTTAPTTTAPTTTAPPITVPRTTDAPATVPPTPTPAPPIVAAEPVGDCTPGYDPCIPSGGGDVDCAGGSGNGPRYVTGPVSVTGSDPYGLDSDHDGIGCE